jgi:uncharacterized alkaline shock family protein YloU
MTESTHLGKIEISPAAVASLANHAVLKSYGVVGMSSRNLAQLLSCDSKRGVKVRIEDGEIIIGLYVIVEYGTRISEVAQNIMENVRFSVEKALGVPVAQVNVYVQGLRVSESG